METSDFYTHAVFFQCDGMGADMLRKIKNYFQIKRKSGGGECGRVTKVDDKFYSIAFKDKDAQERVLQRRDHQLTLEGGPLVLTVQSSPESGASAPLVASTTGQVPTTTPLDLSSTTSPQSVEYELPCERYLLQYIQECEKPRKELEAELALLDCSLQLYPDQERVLVRRAARPGATDERKSWRHEVKKLFANYQCHFEMDMHKVKALLKSSSSQQTSDDVKVYEELGLAVVVGKCAMVRARLERAVELVDKTQRPGVSDRQVRLGEAKLRLLWPEIDQGLRQKLPGVKFTQVDSCNVVLEGSLKDIVEARESLTILQGLVVENIVSDMSPQLLTFLREAYGGARGLRFFLDVDDGVEIDLRDTELRFLSLSVDKLNAAVTRMKKRFKTVENCLAGYLTVPLELQCRLKSLMSEMNQGQCKVEALFGPGGTVCLLGQTEEVKKLSDIVNQFVLGQTRMEEKISLPFPGLEQDLAELLQLQGFNHEAVTFHPEPLSVPPTVVLAGLFSRVAEVKTRLCSFLDSLVQGHVSINLPGAVRFFQSLPGRESISKVSKSQKCLIKLCDQSRATPSDEDTMTVATYTLRDGPQVVVCQGDITKQKADALVNAANEDLEHYGGVAAELSRAGGPTIQKESRVIVKCVGKIPTGDVVVTTGGHLCCKTLLHVVGPRAGAVGGREKSLIIKAVGSALHMAEEMKLESIAIPCISSGVFGVPVVVCSGAIVSAVSEFSSQRGRSLKKVILIDKSVAVVSALDNACQRLFQGIGTKVGESQLKAAPIHPLGGAAGGPPGVVHVEMVQGTVETQQVDALVSPMVGHNLLSSRIGVDLNNMVGPQLKAKFNKDAGRATAPGEIVVLDGLPNLTSKAVFFAHLMPWDNNQDGAAVQVLRQCMRKVLASCRIKGFTSLAVPILGTGAVLKFPHGLASRVLLEEVHQFDEDQASGSSFLVRFVIHPSNRELKKAFEEAQESLNVRGFAGTDNSDNSRSDEDTDTYTTWLGTVKLQMILGNILNAQTDVIVNSTDFSGNHSGVSKEILTAAGPTVQAELTRLGTPAHYFCTTGPGLLGCREIIHATFKCSPELIQKNCKKILQQCEDRGYQSVAFPAINTGAAGMDFRKACQAMLDGITLAVKELQPMSLSLIHIVIFKQNVFQAFRSELESRFGQTVPGSTDMRENPEKEKPLKNLKTTNDAVATSSQFEPAVMVVIGCDVKILTVVETKLEDVLRNHLIEREVKVCDFDRLTHQEQETVLSEVRASGMSMEFRSAPGKAKGKNAEGAVDHYLLRGLKEDVLSVFALISDAVRNYLFEDNQNNQENLMAMIARWYIQDKKKEVWQLLDQKENCELETAHRDKKTSAKITAPDGTVAQVNLKTYTATSQQGTKYKVKKSEISEGFEMPIEWEPMNGESFKKVKLNSTLKEYKKVAEDFKATANHNIITIERVQNVYQWKAFAVCKERIGKKNGLQELGEKFLYHGTAAESCDSIEKGRFDRSFAGQHATMYGKGVYFAVNAQYSARGYSQPDASGTKRMYVARVLTGRYTKGEAQMKNPPPRANDPTDRYDSLVDNCQKPNMFVIFHDDQAYPEYLITFN